MVLDLIKIFIAPEDKLNYTKSRDLHNTNTCYYNCGGYALGALSWYLPWTENDDFEGIEDVNERAELMAEVIQNDFPNLKRVRRKDLTKENDIVIFRVESKNAKDFHFVRYFSDNKRWMHKRGNTEIRRIPQKVAMSRKPWYGRYDSKLIYFEIYE